MLNNKYMVGENFIPVEDKEVVYNNNKYLIYDDSNIGTEINTLGLDGKTFNTTREFKYEDEEYGYVIEAYRINKNKFKAESIWLGVLGLGWSETEYIKNEQEIEFIKNILKQADIELID